jgi:hypothetical protein
MYVDTKISITLQASRVYERIFVNLVSLSKDFNPRYTKYDI